jgi:hypothetical protein
MMAAASLMIETFQCFKEGKKDTKQRGMGETAFVNFFKEHKREFPGINGSEFYKNIRCGILHRHRHRAASGLYGLDPSLTASGSQLMLPCFFVA